MFVSERFHNTHDYMSTVSEQYQLYQVQERSCFLSPQAGWKESHAIFMTELRNLQAFGLTTFGQSLRTSFDLLNLNRLVSGIDNYGQVRFLVIIGDDCCFCFWIYWATRNLVEQTEIVLSCCWFNGIRYRILSSPRLLRIIIWLSFWKVGIPTHVQIQL